MPQREPVVVHSRTHRVFAIVLWLLLTGITASLVTRPDSREAIAAVPTLAASCIVVWAALWQPSVTVDADGVTVRNVLTTRRVPFSALVDISTRWSVTLRTPSVAVPVFVAPQPGRLAAWNARRRVLREGDTDERARLERLVHIGEMPGTESGDIAALVRDRWQSALDEGRVTGGEADAIAVPRTWHRTTIAVLGCAVAIAPVAAWVIAAG